MDVQRSVDPVLDAYAAPLRGGTIEPLGVAGGFSGARFWRITAATGRFCLRCWPPEHPTSSRLETIHRLLRHVDRRGFHLVPVPVFARSGHTFVRYAHRLWQLEPWLSGEANYEAEPSAEKLSAALAALAQFHVAAREFWPSEHARCPGLAARREQLSRLLRGQLERLAAALAHDARWPALVRRGQRLLRYGAARGPVLLQQLDRAICVDVPLQPCIRDIHGQHVLFSGSRVSGIIDFGAVGRDSVAIDISRLLGSLAGSDVDAWQAGLAAYESVRRLSPAERLLLGPLDQAGLLLGGFNWLQWVFLEGRQFEDRPAVEQRVARILDRLGDPPVQIGP